MDNFTPYSALVDGALKIIRRSIKHSRLIERQYRLALEVYC
ncbi:MAG: hypothetical protein WC685_10095 [Methylobacter sp.]|jgi:hypothetical protein